MRVSECARHMHSGNHRLWEPRGGLHRRTLVYRFRSPCRATGGGGAPASRLTTASPRAMASRARSCLCQGEGTNRATSKIGRMRFVRLLRGSIQRWRRARHELAATSPASDGDCSLVYIQCDIHRSWGRWRRRETTRERPPTHGQRTRQSRNWYRAAVDFPPSRAHIATPSPRLASAHPRQTCTCSMLLYSVAAVVRAPLWHTCRRRAHS
jgi:hypothetical protein